MKTNTLNLNTGVNWQSNAVIQVGAADNYWRISTNDVGPAPLCAIACSHGCNNILPSKMALSTNPSGICTDNMNVLFANKNGRVDEEETIQENLLHGLANEGLKIYPNPASTRLTLEYQLSESSSAVFYLYDMLGREWCSLVLAPAVQRVSFGIAQLPRGIYIGKYVVNGTTRSTQKIIIN